jgi:hypothetical protein
MRLLAFEFGPDLRTGWDIAQFDPAVAGGIASALAGRRLPPVTSGFVGR